MTDRIVLASSSKIRAEMLRAAGVDFTTTVSRIDEELVKRSLEAEQASARDIADALAEMKAQKASLKDPDALVIGCDQVLDLKKSVQSKPTSPSDAKAKLMDLSGKTHALLSAAVIYQNGEPLWRHVGRARLAMHQLSEAYVNEYVDRNWDDIRHCVGCYQIEAEGVRLFSRIDGDHFTILGMPLLELLSYLALRGTLSR
jgi:septum formation protein